MEVWGKNWPRYNGTILYIVYLRWAYGLDIVAVQDDSIFGQCVQVGGLYALGVPAYVRETWTNIWVQLTKGLPSWWRHQMETFSALLALCAGNSPVPVNSRTKASDAELWSFLCWINGWVNNREAGDLRRNRTHYDVNVMANKRAAILQTFSSSFSSLKIVVLWFNTKLASDWLVDLMPDNHKSC